MKKTVRTLCVLLSLLVVLSPIILLATAVFTIPSQYDNSFVGILDEKHDALLSEEDDKIVIVGGSSVAFGVDSDIIEKYTEMPVINFGLYAALGTKLMLDLSRGGIKEGDIVVIAPELDPQTLSLYFSSEATWQAIDGDISMLSSVGADNYLSMLGGSWKYAKEKLGYFLTEKPDPEGVYNAKNFDENGDLVYTRANNTMRTYYDPNNMIDLSPDILSEDFADYLNEYISYCTSRGATVYFSYCPMNRMGLKKGVTDESAKAFETYLKDKINCTFISNINEYIYDAEYFYDTNFHLNDVGSILHSVNLTKDILLELGIPTRVDEEIPKAPKLPSSDINWFVEDENSVYFEYELTEIGTYKIVGLSELGMSQRTLTVPLGYNGRKVTAIGPSAFEGGTASKLVITADTNVDTIMDGAFTGASTIREMWCYVLDCESILPPASFEGTASGFKVHVPPSSTYNSGYYWAHRKLTFVFDAE
ncbi:MAG: hypothetical protein IJY65_05140 [Clostridia bacterium]|nr:hypothetical protein [Clostridia bacterium]